MSSCAVTSTYQVYECSCVRNAIVGRDTASWFQKPKEGPQLCIPCIHCILLPRLTLMLYFGQHRTGSHSAATMVSAYMVMSVLVKYVFPRHS